MVAAGRWSSNGATTGDEVIDDQQDYGADHCHEHAVNVETSDTRSSKLVEKEAPDNGTDNAEHDVENKALAFFIDDLAGDEARDQPENDPADNRHLNLLV